MSVKSLYLITSSFRVLSYSQATNKRYPISCTIKTNISASKAVTYATNNSENLSIIIDMNLWSSICSNRLVLDMAFVAMLFFKISSLASNLMFVLPKNKINIPYTTSILVLISKKIFSKNWILHRLSQIENWIKIILNVFKKWPSIFRAPKLIFLVISYTIVAKTSIMVFRLLVMPIKALE